MVVTTCFFLRGHAYNNFARLPPPIHIMPKKKKGGCHRTRKQIKHGTDGRGEARELIFVEDGQTYAMVESVLGQGRFTLRCMDGVERLGILRGKMHKRNWVRQGNVVVASLRDYEDNKADIVHVYLHEEVRQLLAYNELTPAFMQQSAELNPNGVGAAAAQEEDVVFEVI